MKVERKLSLLTITFENNNSYFQLFSVGTILKFVRTQNGVFPLSLVVPFPAFTYLKLYYFQHCTCLQHKTFVNTYNIHFHRAIEYDRNSMNFERFPFTHFGVICDGGTII